jgi:ribosome maturation protein SDO1
MVKLDDAVLAKLKKNDLEFEIYVDPYLAWDYKHGKDINFDDLIAYEAIYTNAKKGEEVSPDDLNKVFKTTDFQTIVKEIILHGDVQLTTAQKQEMLEKRKREIINYLSKNAHDPKNKTPIPEQRIINAFEELKIKVNLSNKKDKEIQEIIDKLKKIMPISLDKIVISVEIPGSYAGKASSIVYKYEIIDQKWLPSGGLIARIKIPSGIKQQLVSDLNNVTHGNLVIKVEDLKE